MLCDDFVMFIVGIWINLFMFIFVFIGVVVYIILVLKGCEVFGVLCGSEYVVDEVLECELVEFVVVVVVFVVSVVGLVGLGELN